MYVENRSIAKKLFVTPHAVQRFDERNGETVDLTERLSRAIPFGGQVGGDLLLIDDNIVFAIDPKECVVLTCLTKEQAIANMQLHKHNLFVPDHRRPKPKILRIKPEKKMTEPSPPVGELEKLKREVVKLNRERCLLKVAMEEVLSQTQYKAVRERLKGLKMECREFPDANPKEQLSGN